MVDSKREGYATDPPSFLRSAALTYGTTLIASVVSLINVIVTARALGADGRGQVAFLTAIAWLVSNVATVSVPEANSNFAAADPASRRSLASNSVALSAVLGVLGIATLALLVWVFPVVAGDSDDALLWATMGFLPVLILQPCLRSLAQADYAFAVTNASYLVPALINVGINGVLAVFGVLTVGIAVGTWLGGQLVATVMVIWYISSRLSGFGRPDLPLAVRSLVFGAKAHVGRVMQLGNYRLDQWLLGAIAGSRELGYYSVAVAWAEALWYLPSALASVQRPDLVRAVRRKAAPQAATVFRGALVVTAASAAVMLVAAPLLCTVAFGPEFEESVDDLRVLVLGAFGMVALKLLGNALVARGWPLLQSLAVGSGFVLTIILDVILIDRLGGLGAALASTVAYSVAGAVVVVAFIRALDGSFRDLVPRFRDVTGIVRVIRDRIRLSRSSVRESGVDGRNADSPYAESLRAVAAKESDDHAEPVGGVDGRKDRRDAGK